MSNITRTIALLAFTATVLRGPALLAQQDSKSLPPDESAPPPKIVLWSNPTDIASRNLFYGEGGDQDAPRDTTFTYEKQDLNGTNPKFDVRDENGQKWRIKLGEEAKPEVVATRLLWAVGFFTSEEYFLPEVHVDGMKPVNKKTRKRIRHLIDPDGTMRDAELKAYPKGEKKIGTWRWRKNPFTGTRELNGLRVMMALLNNWDLKDANNAVYVEKTARHPESATEDENKEYKPQTEADGGNGIETKTKIDAESKAEAKTDGEADAKSDTKTNTKTDEETVYIVSDVGASFGTIGRVRHREIAKGNLNSYQHSRFIKKKTANYVDFYVPSRESTTLAVNPKEFIARLHLRWIGRRIPRADAKWIGQLLAQLSPDQIRDAFRAGGYSSEEVDAFAEVVQNRIAELNDL